MTQRTRSGQECWHEQLAQLARREPLTVKIHGECMAPLIPDGARVSVRSEPRYWPGDVVVAGAHNGDYLAHRVLGFGWHNSEWTYISCADNARRADAAFPGSAILGRVCGGDCDSRIVDVPLSARGVAICRFLPVALLRLKAYWSRRFL